MGSENTPQDVIGSATVHRIHTGWDYKDIVRKKKRQNA